MFPKTWSSVLLLRCQNTTYHERAIYRNCLNSLDSKIYNICVDMPEHIPARFWEPINHQFWQKHLTVVIFLHNSMRLWQCNLNYIRSNPRFNIETTNLCRLIYWSWNFGGYPKPPLIEGGVVTAMPQANEDAGVWSWRMIQTWKMQMCSKTWKHTPYSVQFRGFRSPFQFKSLIRVAVCTTHCLQTPWLVQNSKT
jgi:hypothetical protein